MSSPWRRTAAVAVFKHVSRVFRTADGLGKTSRMKTLALEHVVIAECAQRPSGIWHWRALVGGNFLHGGENKTEHSARAVCMKHVRAKLAEFEELYFAGEENL